MTSLRLPPVASSLLSSSSVLMNGSSFTASAVPVLEQYCFPRYGGPITADSIWPSVTIMYNGTTLTTAPITLVTSRTTSNLVSVPAVSSISSTIEPIAPTSVPSISSRASSWTFSPSGMRGQTASPSAAPDEEASLRSSFTSSANRSRMATGTSPTGSNPSAVISATLVSSGGMNPSTTLGSGSFSRSATGIDRDVRESNTRALSSVSAIGGTSGRVTISGSGASRVTASGGGVTQTTTSPSFSLTESLPFTPSSRMDNGTVNLSPPAIDALHLAQYIKHLGISLFNASISNITSPSGGSMSGSMLPELIADISLQERTQLVAVQNLLSRARGEQVPSCRYLFPSNSTELVWLMDALKSVELGVLISLADSLPPTDTSATILLSSIASVAAKQITLLRTYTNSNVSMGSFDTPTSGTWAYNFILGYIQPGSCALDLPYPILPVLTLNNNTFGYARANTNVTVGWDAAGRSAASRLGKPLFVAWVNQVDLPSFSPLDMLSDNFGTTIIPAGLSGTAFAVLTARTGLTTIEELTEATVAGPIVIQLLMS